MQRAYQNKKSVKALTRKKRYIAARIFVSFHLKLSTQADKIQHFCKTSYFGNKTKRNDD